MEEHFIMHLCSLTWTANPPPHTHTPAQKLYLCCSPWLNRGCLHKSLLIWSLTCTQIYESDWNMYHCQQQWWTRTHSLSHKHTNMQRQSPLSERCFISHLRPCCWAKQEIETGGLMDRTIVSDGHVACNQWLIPDQELICEILTPTSTQSTLCL